MQDIRREQNIQKIAEDTAIEMGKKKERSL
jgi:hypothetical protein